MSDKALLFELPLESVSRPTAGFFLDRLQQLIEDRLISAISIPDRQAVLDAAAIAFDKYVAPYDLPYVPDAVEPVVDSQLRVWWLELVGIVYDKIVAERL
jgi:hypothetical protein